MSKEIKLTLPKGWRYITTHIVPGIKGIDSFWFLEEKNIEECALCAAGWWTRNALQNPLKMDFKSSDIAMLWLRLSDGRLKIEDVEFVTCPEDVKS